MAISNVSSNYTVYNNLYSYNKSKPNETDKTSETRTANSKTSKTKTETAKKSTGEYLSELSKKYTGLNIIGGNASYYKKPKNNCVSSDYRHDVTISPVILEKMMSASEEAAKYEKKLAGIQKYEGWANSMVHALTGGVVYYRKTWIDENGNMGMLSVSGPSEQQKKADEKRKEEEQEAFEKRLEKAREKTKANREQMKEWFQGDKDDLLKINTFEIDTSDLMKLMSIDIKA